MYVRNFCSYGYGDLASIGTVTEQAYIQMLIGRASITNTDVWIGMQRIQYQVNVSTFTLA